MMKTYKAKALIPGYKLGLDPTKYYVGVPSKYFLKEKSIVYVIYKDNQMFLQGDTPVLKQETFKDRYGREEYTLNYYEYVPELKQVRFLVNGGE